MTIRARRSAAACLAALLTAVPAVGPAAASEPIVGTWASPPDNKDQTGHIVVQPCGNAYCGTLARAYSSGGEQIRTENVGRQLLWDMRPQGGGEYDDGRVYVPLFGRSYDAEVSVSGDRLKVRGCLGPVCKSQTWARVQ